MSSDLTLAGLHGVLQVAMGWDGYHLHEFSVDGVADGDPEMGDGWGGITGDHSVTLGQVAGPGGRFSYLYDFGDNLRPGRRQHHLVGDVRPARST